MVFYFFPVASVEGRNLWGDVGQKEGVVHLGNGGAVACRAEMASVVAAVLVVGFCRADEAGD